MKHKAEQPLGPKIGLTSEFSSIEERFTNEPVGDW